MITTSDNQPAAWVSVFLKNTGQGTITDEQGNFEIRKLKSGKYNLSISLEGYLDTTLEVQIIHGETFFLNLQLKGTQAELNTIIVAANKYRKYVKTNISEGMKLNLPLIEIPQSIQVVTQQTLTDQGIQTLTEAIRDVSGVIKTYGSLNDYALSIRGTDANWGVFRNGIGGYAWNQQEDAAMFENIEFIKGPAGFVVSIAQPGGIVNTVTKQPVKEPLANINFAYGSYHMNRIAGDFGGPLSKDARLTYRLNAGYQYQDRSFQYSNASRYFICPVIKYDFSEKTSLTAEYNFVQGTTSGNNTDLPSLNGKMFMLPRNFPVADAATDKLVSNDNYYRIQFKHNFSEHTHLFVQGGYVTGKFGGHTLNSQINIPVSNDTLYRYSMYEDFYQHSTVLQAYVDTRFTTGAKFEHTILIGIDYCKSGLKDSINDSWGEKQFGLYLPEPDYFVPADSLNKRQPEATTNLNWGWTSLYIQDHLKIAEKLVVTLAAHFTHSPMYYENADEVPVYQNNSYANIFSPRFGLTWLFSKNISVYALYDQCFWPQEAPNKEQKPFKPLTGYDLETGLKAFFFDKRLSLNLSFYDIVKNNTLTSDPNGAVNDMIQRGQITSKGIDFDLTGNITPALSVTANYAYVDAKITKDNDPSNVGLRNAGIPDNYCNVWLKYKMLRGKLKNFSFALGYQFMGKRMAEAQYDATFAIHYLPAYNLLDASVSYTLSKWYIILNVYNLTNINYASIGKYYSEINEWRYTPGDPLNFRLGFGVNLLGNKK